MSSRATQCITNGSFLSFKRKLLFFFFIFFLYLFLRQWTFNCFPVLATVDNAAMNARIEHMCKKGFLWFLWPCGSGWLWRPWLEDVRGIRWKQEVNPSVIYYFFTCLLLTHGAGPASSFPPPREVGTITVPNLHSTSQPAPQMGELNYLNSSSALFKCASVNETHSSILLGTFDQKLV